MGQPGDDAALAALYRPRIREAAARVRNDKRLASPDISVNCRSAICGSTLTLDVNWAAGVVSELGWRARACTLGMASTAILVQAAPGQTPAQVESAGALLEKLLAGQEVSFPAGWEDLSMLAVVRAFPARHDSVMLPFKAMGKAAAGSADQHES